MRTRVTSRVSRVLAISAASLLLFGCDLFGGGPTIVGTVRDNFGQPVNAAVVAISNSGFQTQTDSSGAFKLDYAPGSFEVVISANGYTSRTVNLNLGEAANYPLNETTLFRKPDSAGLFVASSTEYLPLLQRAVEGEARDYTWGNKVTYKLAEIDFSRESGLPEDTRSTATRLAEATSESVEGHSDEPLIFIDSTSGDTNMKPHMLEANDAIGSIDFFITGPRDRTFAPLPEEIEVHEGIKIRKVAFPIEDRQSGRTLCFLPVKDTLAAKDLVEQDSSALCIVTSTWIAQNSTLTAEEILVALSSTTFEVGKGLGPIKIGMPLVRVPMVLGRSDVVQVMGADGGKKGEAYHYDIDGINLMIDADLTGSINKIVLLSNTNYWGDDASERSADLRKLAQSLPKVAGGLTLGVSADVVHEALGKPDEVTEGEKMACGSSNTLRYGEIYGNIAVGFACDIVTEIHVVDAAVLAALRD